jgi:LmbE family N-acetylglucosaminyl deacetylase
MRSNLCRGTLASLLSLSLALNGAVATAQQAEPVASYRSAYARPLPIDRGSAGLSQTLQKLHTRASLAMVTAHPDDEDGGMLAYESRGQGVDTALLTLNRGEGGQNVITGDYWDQLGTLRTQELLAAGNYYGVHQYFSRVADFGFSKTIEEALKTWGEDRVLYDAVRAIRIQRPLVVTSVFAGNVSDGHGHHQVAGYTAQKVYVMAGDSKVFPDQIKAGLLPWSPLKVYARVPFARVTDKGIYDYATGHWEPVRFRNYVDGTWIEGVPKATVEIPSGNYNPMLGSSYMQKVSTSRRRRMAASRFLSRASPRAPITSTLRA